MSKKPNSERLQRIRIRQAQKVPDQPDPDPDQQHCLESNGFCKVYIRKV
jgi:hypothetical protein